jgi:hypothetical protein
VVSTGRAPPKMLAAVGLFFLASSSFLAYKKTMYVKKQFKAK